MRDEERVVAEFSEQATLATTEIEDLTVGKLETAPQSVSRPSLGPELGPGLGRGLAHFFGFRVVQDFQNFGQASCMKRP